MIIRSLYCFTLLLLFVSMFAVMVNSNERPIDSLYYNSLHATAFTGNGANDTNFSNTNLSTTTSNVKLTPFSSTSLNSSTINNTTQGNAVDGTLQIPFTGLTRFPITPEISGMFGLNKTTYAMLVTEVSPGSPAQKAGIKGGNITRSISGEILKVGGDIILKVDGNTTFIRNNEAFLNYLQNEKRVGENITLTILRNGLPYDIQMVIETMPSFFWYDNLDEGIRIKYPSDWEVIETRLSKDDIVKFFSPEIVDLNRNSTPAAAGVFVKITPSNDIGLDTIATEAAQDTENTRILSVSFIDLAGLPAYEILYNEYSDRLRPMKVIGVFTIKDGQIYRINFATDLARYDDYLSLAREMMNSFEFTK